MGLTDGVNTYSYVYNGLGDRLQQTVNGATTTYTLDLNTGLTQVLGDGTTWYLYGLGRVGEYGTDWEYYLTDALGSVRQLADNLGVVTMTQTYEPFGDVLVSYGVGDSSYGYAGEQTDASGLQYLRARYYDTGIGRFLTRDVWEGDLLQPMSYNKWAYAYANPVMFTDPSGHIIWPVIIGIATLAISAYTIYQGVQEFNTANDNREVIPQETAAVQTYRDNCMGQCHYPHATEYTPGVSPAMGYPETPVSDLYVSGVTKIVTGTVGVVSSGYNLYSMATAPPSAKLNNYDTRYRYAMEDLPSIPDSIDPTLSLREQAQMATDLRNYYRDLARSSMADVDLAISLELNYPNKSFSSLVSYYEDLGFVGNEIYEQIILAAQRSGVETNCLFGIEAPQPRLPIGE